MYKKGNKPHNKDDDYVKGNYRNKPKKEDMGYGSMKNITGYDSMKYNEMLGKQFIKKWFS